MTRVLIGCLPGKSGVTQTHFVAAVHEIAVL